MNYNNKKYSMHLEDTKTISLIVEKLCQMNLIKITNLVPEWNTVN